MGAVDRKKHDVDVIERVLGGVREDEASSETSTQLMNVEVPWFGGSMRSTVELTVGLPEDSRERSGRGRRR